MGDESMLNFDFKVGEIEIHEVEFYFNQFWGNLYIKLDGNIMIKTISKKAIFSGTQRTCRESVY